MSFPSSSDPLSAGLTRPEPAHRAHLLCVVAAGVLWGTGGLAGVLLGRLSELHPLAVATYRLAGGGFTILAVLALAGRPWRARTVSSPTGRACWALRRARLARVLVVGALTALYQACYFAAVSMTSVGLATLVTLGAAPVLVLAVEALARGKRPPAASMLIIGLALLGLAFLLGIPEADGPGAPLGVSLALVAAGAFAALTLLGRRPVIGLDGPTTIGFGFVVGAVLLGVFTLPTVGLGFTPTAASIGLLLFFSWVPTALAYGLYFTGLRSVSASSAAVVAVLEPVTAALLGALVLGERLSLAGILGAGLLCFAALLAGRRAGG